MKCAFYSFGSSAKLMPYRQICKVKLSLIWIFLFLPFSLSARIWRVDNNASPKGDTASLQGAINAAGAGDTFVIMPSFKNYGTITASKKVFIYGAGHQAGISSSDKTCTIGYLELQSGAAGSVIAGLRITDRFYLNGNNNLILSNELTTGIALQGSNNRIEGNLFSGFFWAFFSPAYIGISAVSGNIIRNNYFSYRTAGGVVGNNFGFISGGDTSTLITNNLLVEVVDGGGAINNGGIVYFRGSNAKIHNNIFWSNVALRTDFDSTSSGADFQRNITYSSASLTDTLKGINFSNQMPLFEGGYSSSNLPYFRRTNQLQLLSTSPGYSNGTDGKDPGLYGGSGYFHIEGKVPWVALMKEFIILNPSIKQGEDLHILLKLNTNQ